MYQIELQDGSATTVMPLLNVPLQQSITEGAVDVSTLGMALYTDFVGTKRQWSHTWKYMTEADFNILKGFYDRQFTSFDYPLLTITELSVSDVSARMELSPQSIIDNCGTVEDVQVIFTEQFKT